MKNAKRLTALGMALLTSASTFITSHAALGSRPADAQAPEKPVISDIFKDIEDGQWYTSGIQYVYDNAYMTGTSATAFEPMTDLTRAQFVQILAKLADADLTSVEYTDTFTDVPDGMWYTNAIMWAYENGYAAGAGDGKFEPNAPVTREQLAVFLCNYGKKNNIFFPDFLEASSNLIYDDMFEISSWAASSLAALSASKVISGTDKKHISPKLNATRAQTALILKNYIERCPLKYDTCIVSTCADSFTLTSSSGKSMEVKPYPDDPTGDLKCYYLQRTLFSPRSTTLYTEQSDSITITTNEDKCSMFIVPYTYPTLPTLSIRGDAVNKITLTKDCEFSFEGKKGDYNLFFQLTVERDEKRNHSVNVSGKYQGKLNGSFTNDGFVLNGLDEYIDGVKTYVEIEYRIGYHGDNLKSKTIHLIKEPIDGKIEVSFADVLA